MGTPTDKSSAKVPIKPKDWPANDRERFLDAVVRLLKDFVSHPSYKTKDAIVAISCNYDYHQKLMLGMCRVTDYEVMLVNSIYKAAHHYFLFFLQTRLYEIVADVAWAENCAWKCSAMLPDRAPTMFRPIEAYTKLEKPLRLFYPPFLLTTTHLNARIRNVQIRILPEGSLVADEVPKYKDESILEALHNCIAHQDYRRNGRVVVTEYVDRLAFSNQGGFYEGRPEDYMHGDKMPTRYRNLQLVKAMREINMIDTMGYGIHRLYNWQVERYFPLPDYKVKSGSVEVTIYGHVVDPAYSSLLLLKRGDLSLDDIALLDRIQKNLSVSSRAVAHLKRAGLVEGRKPHYHISASVAAATGQKAEYMKKRELPGRRYRQLIVDYIGKFEGASRKDINEFMLDEIRGELSVDEKTVKITNLLTYLRRNGAIERRGATKNARWFIVDKAK